MSLRLRTQLKEELHEVLNTLVEDILNERTQQGQSYQMVLCNYLTLSDGALLDIGPNHSQVLFSYGSINYMKSSNPNLVDTYRRGLRYHKLEGQILGPLEDELVEKFAEKVREKINEL